MKRRQLLKRIRDLGLLQMAGSPLQRMLAAVVAGDLYESEKKAQLESRNYLQINMYGAPVRFGFDNLLKPYDDNEFVPFKFVANKIVKQNPQNAFDIEFTYATEKIKGLNMPYRWTQNVPAPHGKSRPMADLMDNMLMIRGVKLDFSGHPLNAMQQICPIQDGLSLNGVVGDASSTLFSSVCVGNNPVTRVFKSEKSLLTEIPYRENNYLEYLLNPFVIKKTDRLYNNAELEKEFDRVLASYPSDLAEIGKIKSTSIKNLRDNITSYMTQYTGLVHKYRDLIDRSIAQTELPLIRGPEFPAKVPKFLFTVPMALGVFSWGPVVCLDNDLGAVLKSGEIKYWAEEFALAEFLLINNLSKSILITSPFPDIGVMLNDCKIKNYLTTGHLEVRKQKDWDYTILDYKKNAAKTPLTPDFKSHVVMDTHDTGLVFEIMATDLFFTAISACTLELVNVLKNTKSGKTNLFDETVIHLASEFDRYPDVTMHGGGSQHNANSNPTSILSGCIKGPLVLGNVYTGTLDKNPNQLYGTLGNGAPVKELGSAVKIGHVSSSLSTLLRVKPIVGRSPSLIKEEDGRIVSLIEKAKNIEGIE
ncbi:MAG: hypothetical protein ACXVAX_07710 [Pseudobdellovibrio sp.]